MAEPGISAKHEQGRQVAIGCSNGRPGTVAPTALWWGTLSPCAAIGCRDGRPYSQYASTPCAGLNRRPATPAFFVGEHCSPTPPAILRIACGWSGMELHFGPPTSLYQVMWQHIQIPLLWRGARRAGWLFSISTRASIFSRASLSRFDRRWHL